jgi:TRAP-type C4-dicarboxylate transport system substrate-binding protein
VYAAYNPETESKVVLDRWWMDEIEKRTQGRVIFKRFYAQTLLKSDEVGKGTGAGQADVGLAASSNEPALFPLAGTFTGLVYIAFNPEVQMRALTKLFLSEPAFAEELKRNNLRLSHAWGTPNTILGSKKPITKLEDLKGMKIRYYGGVGKALELLGATPVSIAYAEIYDALQKGVIDAVCGSPFAQAILSKLHEPAPYFIDPGIGSYGALWTVMNLNSWNKLPTDVQQIISQLDNEVQDRFSQYTMEDEEKKLVEGLATGLKMGELSPEEVKRWSDTAREKYLASEIDKVNKLGFNGADLMKKFEGFAQEAAAKSTYKTIFTVYKEKYKK